MLLTPPPPAFPHPPPFSPPQHPQPDLPPPAKTTTTTKELLSQPHFANVHAFVNECPPHPPPPPHTHTPRHTPLPPPSGKSTWQQQERERVRETHTPTDKQRLRIAKAVDYSFLLPSPLLPSSGDSPHCLPGSPPPPTPSPSPSPFGLHTFALLHSHRVELTTFVCQDRTNTIWGWGVTVFVCVQAMCVRVDNTLFPPSSSSSSFLLLPPPPPRYTTHLVRYPPATHTHTHARTPKCIFYDVPAASFSLRENKKNAI